MADFWQTAGYEPEWDGGGDVAVPPGSFEAGAIAAGDMNPAGAAADPFAYTNGSLLTPWQGRFDGSRFGTGGGGPAPYKPFEYADFDYRAARPDGFAERYDDPGNFVYGDYTGNAPFRGVTDKDLKADKGYQFRQDAAMKILQASKAAQGILKTGGTAKGLQKNASDLASQEYGAVYGRKASEHDRAEDQSRFKYGTNRNNAAENFDRNVTNARTGYQVRQGAWKDNAAVALDASRHGFDVAQGTYDRNSAKARQGYEDLRQYENALASAAASGSAQAYNRALSEYTMARDEFWTNQDRQYNLLDREDMKGRDAAYRYADSQFNYGSAGAENAYQAGNARASGRVGSANAWNSALGTIGQNVGDLAMYAMRRPGLGGTSTGQVYPTPYSDG